MDSLENHYFEKIRPMVDAGIQYDEELELDELMLQEITELVEEKISRLNDEVEQYPIKGPDVRKQKRRKLKKHHRKLVKIF